MARRSVEIISCDWCGRDLSEKESPYFIYINGQRNGEICSYCYDKLTSYADKIREEKWRETSNEV